jgi:hypothetical protein
VAAFATCSMFGHGSCLVCVVASHGTKIRFSAPPMSSAPSKPPASRGRWRQCRRTSLSSFCGLDWTKPSSVLVQRPAPALGPPLTASRFPPAVPVQRERDRQARPRRIGLLDAVRRIRRASRATSSFRSGTAECSGYQEVPDRVWARALPSMRRRSGTQIAALHRAFDQRSRRSRSGVTPRRPRGRLPHRSARPGRFGSLNPRPPEPDRCWPLDPPKRCHRSSASRTSGAAAPRIAALRSSGTRVKRGTVKRADDAPGFISAKATTRVGTTSHRIARYSPEALRAAWEIQRRSSADSVTISCKSTKGRGLALLLATVPAPSSVVRDFRTRANRRPWSSMNAGAKRGPHPCEFVPSESEDGRGHPEPPNPLS